MNMLEEPEFCSSPAFSPFPEESGDEELSVLPMHTKVVVTGNNRTKSVLVGLQGVVKKAVGLGGWHWLVLKNGIEVKLQRNALSVLEHSTGDEDDEDCGFESSSSSKIAIKNHHHYHPSSCVEFRKPRMPKVRHARPWVMPSGSGRAVNRGSYRDVQSLIATPEPRVNLSKLGTNALRRYCKYYKLTSSSDNNISKERMLNSVRRHFACQRVNEKKVITDFIEAAAKKLNKGGRGAAAAACVGGGGDL